MNPKICPTCHSPIPVNAPGGFCPACLLRDAEESLASGHAAPSLEEIAGAFPQLEVLGLIGQGGMGFVYQVRQPGLDRVVALKILSPELGRDPAFAERFAREARVLGKLHHPNIVTVFEHGESGGFFYLLMEFVDGVNLRQAMRAGRFAPEQALAIVPGICDALQAAHAQGIWHRDIKPENILLDARGGVKIADFGIARIVGDQPQNFTLTMPGGALGSAAYMAPEQHENPRDVDHRADIYSLGVVIYEMLTGELPLGRFPAPSQRAAVNARIDEIVFRTLEKERELRQQSAGEVKTDMQGAGGGNSFPSGIQVRPVSSSPSELGRVAFGLFLTGILVPLLATVILPAQSLWGFALGAIALLLGLIIGIAARKERPGRIAWIGSAVFLVTLPALMFLRMSILSYVERQTDAAYASRRIKYEFEHPQDTGGCGFTLPAKVSKGWSPNTGQPISLKGGGVVWVRVRLAVVDPQSILALAESSSDGKNWESEAVTLRKDAPLHEIHFPNGTKGTVRLLQPEVERRATATPTPLPVPEEFSTPEKLVKFHIKMAEDKNHGAFECDTSTRLIDQITRQEIDSRPFMQKWAGLSSSHGILEEGNRAVVRLVDRKTGSEYNAPVVLRPEGNWQIDSFVPIDVTGCTLEEGLRRTNVAVIDFTTVRRAMQAMIDAAKRKDAETFKRGMSAELLEMTLKEDPALAEWMRDWASLTYGNEIAQDGDHAVVRMMKERKQIPMTLVREEGEWKVAAPEDGDSPRAAMEEFLKALKEKNREAMKARSSQSLIAIADDDGPLQATFGHLSRSRVLSAKGLDEQNAEVTMWTGDEKDLKSTFRMIRENGAWKVTEKVVQHP